MKIVTWNCNMAFRKKCIKINEVFDPDIMVIQECEEPNKLRSTIGNKYEILWIGDNNNKGLPIISKNHIKVKQLTVRQESVRYMLPVELGNGYKIIAFWAMNDKKTSKYIMKWARPHRFANRFGGEGRFKADTVIDEGLGGCPDPLINNVCLKEKMILVTLDLDFSDIRAYPPSYHDGIIVMRLSNQSKKRIIVKLTQIIPVIKAEEIKGCIWIVDEKRIRIRGGLEWS